MSPAACITGGMCVAGVCVASGECVVCVTGDGVCSAMDVYQRRVHELCVVSVVS